PSHAARGQGARRGHQRPRAPPQARPGESAGRHRAQARAASHLQRRDCRERLADPRPFRGARRQEGPRRGEDPGGHVMADKYIPRSKAVYDEKIVKAMTEKFGYKNHMEVPKIEKIVLNMGVGEATQDKKKVTTAAEEMELIAGQKPVITKAKKSIATF